LNKPFEFTEPFGDARVAELRLLSWIDQHEQLTIPSIADGPWRDLFASVLLNDLLTTFSYAEARDYLVRNGQGSSPRMTSTSGIAGESNLERALVRSRIDAVDRLYRGEDSDRLRLTHRGRVRLSELKQILRSGREREPLGGVLWDARHWEQDLQVALFDASPQSPLSVAYMDMNGLRELNNTRSHDLGDRGLIAYFEAVASVVDDSGGAYRLGGGADEVLAIFPSLDGAAVLKRVEAACQRLMQDSVNDSEIRAVLSIAAGIVCTTDSTMRPGVLRSNADEQQKRAKEESRKTSPRPSVIAVEGIESLIVLQPPPG